MKIYGKIVLVTMPLVLFSLMAAVATSYYFSHNALKDLAKTLLAVRLSEAVKVAEDQTDMLYAYELEHVPASVAKAKSDAGILMSSIRIGEEGFIFGVDDSGHVVVHPDSSLIGTDMSQEPWLPKPPGAGKGQIVYRYRGINYLAIYDYYRPWGWTLFAVDAEREIYLVIDRMKPAALYLGVFFSIVVALVLMLLTRKLTTPLGMLTSGAKQIGLGKLNTRIPVKTQDELGDLAGVFNAMADRLEGTLSALSRNEKYFRSLIENATDVITILDREGRIVYKSPSAEKILGYPVSELIGNTFSKYIHPEDQSDFKTHLANLFRSQHITGPVEIRFRRKDGLWCTLEIMSNNLLGDTTVSGVIINSRDISKRKQAEDDVRRAEQQYRSIFENAIEGIYQTRPDGRLIAANPSLSNIMGFDSPDDMLSSRDNYLQNYYVDADDHRWFLNKLEKEGWLSGFEAQTYRKDGKKIWVTVSARVHKDAAGRTALYEGSILDITKRKEATVALKKAKEELERRIVERTAELARVNVNLRSEIEERRQAEEKIKVSLSEKEVLLSEVHHRVKNNLQIITSLLDLSKRQATQQETIDFLAMAHARILSMALIHNQLYRSERFDRIDMKRYCQDLLDKLHHIYQNSSPIETSLVSKNVYLTVNQAIPCALAFNELVSNAYKHAFPGRETGKIDIEIKQNAGDTIFFSIKDNGCGFPTDLEIDRIDSLGYRLVRNLVEKQLKGRLEIESRQGTTVHFTFQMEATRQADEEGQTV